MKQLQTELEALKTDLIARYHSLGMKASGNWEQTLSVEVSKVETYGLRGIIWGENYTQFMQHGRSGGKLPPIKAIENWILNKGIRPLHAKNSTTSLAWAIAKNIAKQGTKRFQNKGEPPFIDAVITPERIQQIIDAVGVTHSAQIQAQIISFLSIFNK